jgi:hypothetical protein
MKKGRCSLLLVKEASEKKSISKGDTTHEEENHERLGSVKSRVFGTGRIRPQESSRIHSGPLGGRSHGVSRAAEVGTPGAGWMG